MEIEGEGKEWDDMRNGEQRLFPNGYLGLTPLPTCEINSVFFHTADLIGTISS